MSNEIAKAFDIDTPTEYPSKEVTVADVEQQTNQLQERVRENIDQDYTFVRKNLKEMIESTMEMIPNMVDLVQQSESPRMYEAASAFMKTVADLNKDLIGTSKELEKTAPVKGQTAQVPGIVSENTQVFIGTGSDIFAQLSKRKMTDIEALPVIND